MSWLIRSQVDHWDTSQFTPAHLSPTCPEFTTAASFPLNGQRLYSCNKFTDWSWPLSNSAPSVHMFHRSTNDDYRGSGFDRGHLAAAANHKWSQKAMDDTFYLSNVAPQVNMFYTGKHVWSEFTKNNYHPTSHWSFINCTQWSNLIFVKRSIQVTVYQPCLSSCRDFSLFLLQNSISLSINQSTAFIVPGWFV